MFSLDKVHFVNVLPPVADAFDTSSDSDIVQCMGGSVSFLIVKGVGATGTSTVTVEACDDTTPTTTSTVPFWYREYTTSDVPAAWTHVAATGFTFTAGSNYMVEVRVDPGELAALGYEYVRLSTDEVTNSEVLAGVIAIVENLRYAAQDQSLID